MRQERRKEKFVKKIKIGGARGKGKYALVDDDQYLLLKDSAWHLGIGGYAIRNHRLDQGKRKHQRMHRLVMNAPEGLEVDHINHDPLDNRRANLRLATHSQNGLNRTLSPKGYSKFLGVRQGRWGKGWQACIKIDDKDIYIGTFDDEVEAAYVRDQFADQLSGGFATMNFL